MKHLFNHDSARVVRRAVAAYEANDGKTGGAMAQGSTLSPNPQSLYLLWDEYTCMRMVLGGERQLGYFQERREGKSRISSIDERLSGIA